MTGWGNVYVRAGCALALATALVTPSLQAQRDSVPSLRPFDGRVVVRDVGPGWSGRWLRDALAAGALVYASDTAHPATFPRDTSFGRTLVVVGGPATVASVVHGDVIVVGGDLFLRPGVQIDGRAIAIGGGVYWTSLGTVRGGRYAFQDHTYLPHRLADGTVALDYHPLEVRDVRVVSWPGVYGLRIPSYDRTNGLSVPFGPTLSLDTARFEIDPLVVYRSQLGVVDPQLHVRAGLGRHLQVTAVAGRQTLSNDRWIYGDFVNSMTTLFAGNDVRNYYRGDRIDARIAYRWEGAAMQFSARAGGLTERAWSVRPDSGAGGGPWSVLGRRDRERMLRPNPRVEPGRITSAIAGGRAEWDQPALQAHLDASVELPLDAVGDASFVQTTIDGKVVFPTFSTQRMEVETHAVVTSGDTAPAQRFAYLGGSGTLPTFDLLEFGGDQLFFVEGRYVVPIDRVRIRVLGVPTFTVRYMAGAAGVGELPSFEQNVGVRLAISLVKVDFVVDPATRESKVSFGISLAR